MYNSPPERVMILGFTGTWFVGHNVPCFCFSLAGLALMATVLIFLLMTCCHIAVACFNRLVSEKDPMITQDNYRVDSLSCDFMINKY